MKRLLMHFSLFTILIFSVLTLADFCVTTGLKKSHSPLFDNMTNIYGGKINADLIINGNSHAQRQIDPHIIDSILSVNSYNIGQDASAFLLQKLIYDLYQQHNKKPNYIIQIVDAGIFEKNDGLYQRIKYAPYLKDSLVRDVTSKVKGFDWFDHRIPFIRYAGFSKHIINGFSNFFGIKLPIDSNENYKGYYAYNEVIDTDVRKIDDELPNGLRSTVNLQVKALMEEFIRQCENQNIKIVLVYPPILLEARSVFKNEKRLIETFTDIADENNILFLDYSEDSLSYLKKYYFDFTHLNKKGAEVFTEKLSLDLKNNLYFEGENN